MTKRAINIRSLGWLVLALIMGGIIYGAKSDPKPSDTYSLKATEGGTATDGTTGKVAENGSYSGQISENTDRPKDVHVNGYTRKDGTYVREHYRSAPSSSGKSSSGSSRGSRGGGRR